MGPIDDLRALAPPPPVPTGRTVDWERVAGRLGLALPSDYRQMVTEWGAGSFDDYLTVYEPDHPNRHLELVQRAEGWRWSLEEMAKDEPLPFPSHIGVGGLLAWGASGAGDPFFWHVRTEDPQTWVVFVQEARGPDWGVFEGGVTEFLVVALKGENPASMFPEDLPSPAPGFVRG